MNSRFALRNRGPQCSPEQRRIDVLKALAAVCFLFHAVTVAACAALHNVQN